MRQILLACVLALSTACVTTGTSTPNLRVRAALVPGQTYDITYCLPGGRCSTEHLTLVRLSQDQRFALFHDGYAIALDSIIVFKWCDDLSPTPETTADDAPHSEA